MSETLPVVSEELTRLAVSAAAARPIRRYAVNELRRRRHRRYVVTVSVWIVLAMSMNMLPIYRQYLQKYLAIGDADFGVLFSMGPLVGIAVALLAGPLVERKGTLRMLRYCLRLSALGMAILALAGPHWRIMAVGYALSTGALGAMVIAANRYIMQLFPKDCRRMMALSMAVLSAGGILLPLLGETLLALPHYFPRLSLAWIFHGPFVLVASAMWAASYGYRGRSADASKIRRRAAQTTRLFANFRLPWPVMILACLWALHGAADTALAIWLPRFLGRADFASGPVRPGVAMAAASVAYLLARSLLSVLPEHFGRKYFLILPGLLGGSLMIGGVLSGHYWLTLGCYIAGAFIWSVEFPAIQALMAERSGRQLGAALALAGIPSGLLTFLLIQCSGWLAATAGENSLTYAILLPAAMFPMIGFGGWLWARCYLRHSAS